MPYSSKRNYKVKLYRMSSTRKYDFMLPDLAMPSHLHSPSQPFLKYQIAKRDKLRLRFR